MAHALEKRIGLGWFELKIGLDAAVAERMFGSGLARRARRLVRETGTLHGRAAAAPTAQTNAIPTTPEARTILNRIAGVDWYHTIELPHQVVTPGCVDHRAQIEMYGLPVSMHGMRALDVATFDGYFAFEMERRGAEVVAIDLDSWLQCDLPRAVREHLLASGGDRPMGLGFQVARELLGSRVDRFGMSVYDLSPDALGTFDLVFLSDVLLHLRDPLRGLESIASVLRPGGVAVIAEPYAPDLSRYDQQAVARLEAFEDGVWWRPSLAALTTLVRLAGFEPVEEVSRFRLQATWQKPVDKIVLKGHRRS